MEDSPHRPLSLYEVLRDEFLALYGKPPPEFLNVEEGEQEGRGESARDEDAPRDRANDGRLLRQHYRQIHTHPEGLSALCLSGRDARSSAFGLGFLQELARRGLLPQFDYLSTVAGGSCVGGWLAAWTHRHLDGLAGVCRGLTERPQSGFAAEADSVSHLRERRNQLGVESKSPSTDPLTNALIYLRNLLLNWLMLIPLFAAALALPRAFAAVSEPSTVRDDATLRY